MPFLEDMKYRDAGVGSATPDTLLAPGQSILKAVYISRVRLESNEWSIIGEPVLRSNTMTITLILKVLDDKGTPQYVSVTSPAVGIPEAKQGESAQGKKDQGKKKQGKSK